MDNNKKCNDEFQNWKIFITDKNSNKDKRGGI